MANGEDEEGAQAAEPRPRRKRTLTCRRCGYTWEVRTRAPRKCPGCQHHDYRHAAPKPRTCPHCKTTWQAKKKRPKRCPACFKPLRRRKRATT